MGDVIHCTFTPKTKDGGKARIQAKRAARNYAEPIVDWRLDDSATIDTRCDLSMDHADNGVPCDSAP